MTPTTKAVQRVTVEPFAVLYRDSRPIVVRIEGSILRFREHGRRQWFDLPIDEAFRIAVKCASGFRLHMMPDRISKTKLLVKRSKL